MSECVNTHKHKALPHAIICDPFSIHTVKDPVRVTYICLGHRPWGKKYMSGFAIRP